jgi:hypothetical protein
LRQCNGKWPRDDLKAKEQRNANSSRVCEPRSDEIYSESGHDRMRNAASRTGNSQDLFHQAEVGHMGNDWNQQQNEHRGNPYGKMMPAPFRDTELCQNPTWAKINLHALGPVKQFQNSNSLGHCLSNPNRGHSDPSLRSGLKKKLRSGLKSLLFRNNLQLVGRQDFSDLVAGVD